MVLLLQKVLQLYAAKQLKSDGAAREDKVLNQVRARSPGWQDGQAREGRDGGSCPPNDAIHNNDAAWLDDNDAILCCPLHLMRTPSSITVG